MLTAAVQMEQNKTKYDCMPRLIFNGPYGSNFLTILDFFIGDKKKLAVVERLLGTLRNHGDDGNGNVKKQLV